MNATSFFGRFALLTLLYVAKYIHYSALSNFLEVSCQNVLTKPYLTCHSQFLPDIVDGNFKNYWRDDSIIYSFKKTLLESV